MKKGLSAFNLVKIILVMIGLFVAVWFVYVEHILEEEGKETIEKSLEEANGFVAQATLDRLTSDKLIAVQHNLFVFYLNEEPIIYYALKNKDAFEKEFEITVLDEGGKLAEARFAQKILLKGKEAKALPIILKRGIGQDTYTIIANTEGQEYARIKFYVSYRQENKPEVNPKS
ncbi:MAG: hypothetical protein QW331_03190 [Candidatus Woesearchaeota archaeon]